MSPADMSWCQAPSQTFHRLRRLWLRNSASRCRTTWLFRPCPGAGHRHRSVTPESRGGAHVAARASDLTAGPETPWRRRVWGRGEGGFSGDIAFPGWAGAAMLRSPYARARVARLDLTRARAADGVRGAVGPDECHVLTLEPNFEGQPVAAVCADTEAQA